MQHINHVPHVNHVTYAELKYMIVPGDITGLPVPLGATGFERFCPLLLSY